MNRDRVFAVAATLAVLAGLALGFRELGPPRVQRAENADITRSRNLEAISRALDVYYRRNQHLPAALEELKTTQAGLQISDPETKAPYSYTVLNETTYSLCATFATDNRLNAAAPGEMAHPAGTHCTSYVVNKRLY